MHVSWPNGKAPYRRAIFPWQFFLDKFYVLVCMAKNCFPWQRAWLKSWSCQLFEKEEKIVCCTHEKINSSRNLSRKNSWSVGGLKIYSPIKIPCISCPYLFTCMSPHTHHPVHAPEAPPYTCPLPIHSLLLHLPFLSILFKLASYPSHLLYIILGVLSHPFPILPLPPPTPSPSYTFPLLPLPPLTPYPSYPYPSYCFPLLLLSPSYPFPPPTPFPSYSFFLESPPTPALITLSILLSYT